MIGPPGAGKTLLARHAGLVGGGNWPHPGEISLAHRGVLFLDELPEFGPRVLEVMRQPIEDKIVTISRAQGSLTFPANFQLIAAMSPCPCGYYGDPVKACTCSAGIVTKYQKRISGPLLDRIDIHIEVPRVEYEKLSDNRMGEPSAAILARVESSRQRQRERFSVGRSSPIQETILLKQFELGNSCYLKIMGTKTTWLTLILTTTTAESSSPSFTTKEKLSSPAYPSAGV